MPRSYEFGRTDDATHPQTMRATLAEFLSTFVYVFAAEGSLLALDRMYSVRTLGASSLVLIALANAFSFFAAVSSAINISGGHVNPAITLGALVGGRISLVRAIYYWLGQLLGAVIASLLLRFATDGMRPVGFQVASGIGIWHALLMEVILTYAVMHAYYSTAIDPKRGHLGTIAPLVVALMVGASVLVGGPFSGASMNPARAFGPALVGWRWRNHWIYWLGPFIGAALSGVVYEFGIIEPDPATSHPARHPTHQPLAPEDY